MNRCNTTLIYLLFFLIYGKTTGAQTSLIVHKKNLVIIKDIKTFKRTIENNRNLKMLDIKALIPTIELDLRYATANNFLNKKLYPETQTTFMRMKAITQLDSIQKELRNQGLGLKIYDAYRPYYVTKKIWNQVKDERYAADPKKGSGHNRGIAVDVTIINLKSKKELEMGTGFDSFTDTAHHHFKQLPNVVLQNRLILKNLMERYGFKALESEWWHYSLPNADEYDILNLSFRQLRKINFIKTI
jgi:zinc D-Ala-D-Ala dipeptidase